MMFWFKIEFNFLAEKCSSASQCNYGKTMGDGQWQDRFPRTQFISCCCCTIATNVKMPFQVCCSLFSQSRMKFVLMFRAVSKELRQIQ